MLALDYVGVATLITATCAGIASIVAVILAKPVKTQVAEVHAAVSMSNGGTLAGAVEQIDRSTVPAGVPPIAP